MNKIFVDLGLCTHAIINRREYPPLSDGAECEPVYGIDIFDEGGVDEGAYIPPRHISLNRDGLKVLYDALKAIYKPTVVG